MPERPILFSAPMVRALLEGRKSQTRRICKVRKGLKFQELIERGERRPGGIIHATQDMLAPPPYAPGDRLWVREGLDISHEEVRYSADRVYLSNDVVPEDWSAAPRNRPAIHMPRWASRLTLLVTDVRVERLQDISEADAIAEGVQFETADPPFYYVPGIFPHSLTGVEIREGAAASFAKLWNSLHGPDAWAQNPWVVAVSFEVRKGNIDR